MSHNKCFISSLEEKNLQITELHSDCKTACELLYCTYTAHLSTTRQTSLTSNQHTGYVLVNVKKGGFRYVPNASNATTIDVPANQLFLINCSSEYSLSVKPNTTCDFLFFDGHNASYFCEHLLCGNSFYIIEMQNALEELFHELLYQKKEDSPLNQIIFNSNLTKFLTMIIISNQKSSAVLPSYLCELKTDMEKNYYKDFSLEKIEQQYKTNRYRICKDFKTYLGISPMQYLHNLRIHAAQTLLRDTDMKIYEISYQVGYENVNHFINHFKKIAGVTPAEYRKYAAPYF